MTYYNQNNDFISTVQLSPFVEEQWHRIDTYSPIYVHWTDMLMNTTTPQRTTHRPTSGKLNVIDQIDLNALKLDDEILFREIHDIRKGSALLSKAKNVSHELKFLNDKQEEQTELFKDRFQDSSDFFNETDLLVKDGCTLTEPSLTNLQTNQSRPISSNQSNPIRGNNMDLLKKFPRISLGTKPQPALATQLRQSAMARQNVLSAINDQYSPTPRPVSTLKRSVSSAHSSRHYQQQQPRQQSPLRHEVNSIASVDDQVPEESLPTPIKSRSKSAHCSRSAISMVKAKNDRMRQKQSIELNKTVLIKPWRQTTWNSEIFDETIPNSLDVMHKICGPATPFERNLRYSYRKHLSLYRHGSMKT